MKNRLTALLLFWVTLTSFSSAPAQAKNLRGETRSKLEELANTTAIKMRRWKELEAELKNSREEPILDAFDPYRATVLTRSRAQVEADRAALQQEILELTQEVSKTINWARPQLSKRSYEKIGATIGGCLVLGACTVLEFAGYGLFPILTEFQGLAVLFTVIGSLDGVILARGVYQRDSQRPLGRLLTKTQSSAWRFFFRQLAKRGIRINSSENLCQRILTS